MAMVSIMRKMLKGKDDDDYDNDVNIYNPPNKHMVCRAPIIIIKIILLLIIIIIIQLWSQYWPATNPASIWYAELQAGSSIRLLTLHIFFGIGKYIQLLNIISINIIITIFSLDLESTSKTSSSTVSPLECTEADWVYRQNATSVKYFKRRKLQKGTIYQFFIFFHHISSRF